MRSSFRHRSVFLWSLDWHLCTDTKAQASKTFPDRRAQRLHWISYYLTLALNFLWPLAIWHFAHLVWQHCLFSKRQYTTILTGISFQNKMKNNKSTFLLQISQCFINIQVNPEPTEILYNCNSIPCAKLFSPHLPVIYQVEYWVLRLI